jgi:hypothetical protein
MHSRSPEVSSTVFRTQPPNLQPVPSMDMDVVVSNVLGTPQKSPGKSPGYRVYECRRRFVNALGGSRFYPRFEPRAVDCWVRPASKIAPLVSECTGSVTELSTSSAIV